MTPADTPTLTRTLKAGLETVALSDARAQLRSPGGEQSEATLGLNAVRIGTSPDCDLLAHDGQVSRVHAALKRTDHGFSFRDLGSKNGSFAAGVRVVEVVLLPGQKIQLGNSELVVRPAGEVQSLLLSKAASFGGAYGLSLQMRVLFSQLEQAAASGAPILLWGESGTGKEVLARAIHDASPRASRPFVIFDCASVVPSLIESQLFGHVKGAFTGAQHDKRGLFEEADGGTLFIDELGELPLAVQTRLLRVLETRQFQAVGSGEERTADFRVISATHRDLRSRMASGEFRQDLFFRLAAIEAVIPPLRERPEDIPLLIEAFLLAEQPPRRLSDFPSDLIPLLQAHSWPGNVRELWNMLTRLRVLPHLGAESLSPPYTEGTGSTSLLRLPFSVARATALAEFERWYLSSRLAEHEGKVAEAAASMGISRQLVYRLLARSGKNNERE